MIKVSGLHKYYNKGKQNEAHVLKGLDIEFSSSGLVCILGESGCGKTTFLNAIGGLDSFDEGEVQLDDEIIKKYKMHQIERIRNDRYGYIFQNYFLLSDQTVEENIMIALSMFDLSSEEKEERVEYTLESLGLTKYRKKKVANLSGGQQQRVSIARALVKSPDIILADEPTGNLDEENTLNTMSILRAISKKCLVLLVTHEREMAKLFADRIVEIVDGEVKADYVNKSKDSFTKSDDQAIYLAEYERQEIENNLVSISLYSKAEDKPDKFKIKIVFKDGSIYIQNESEQVIHIEDAESDFSINEGKAPKITMDLVSDFDFSLEDIKSKNTNRLSWKQLGIIARENRKAMGKRQAFMVVTILAATIMLAVVISDYINSRHINKREFASADSHMIEVKISLEGHNTGYEYGADAKQDFCYKYSDSTDKYKVFGRLTHKVSLIVPEFAQLENADKSLNDACILPISVIGEGDLICGRMPENSNEVVIDKLLLDRFIEDNPIFGTLFRSTSEYLGREISLSVKGNCQRIVGISDLNEPDIFVGDKQIINFRYDKVTCSPLSELKKAYPEQYEDVKLGYDEALVTESIYKINHREEYSNDIVAFGEQTEMPYEFTMAGSYADDYYTDMVVDDKVFDSLEKVLYCTTSGFRVYVYDKDDIDEVMDYFAGLGKQDDYSGGIKLDISYTYGEQLEEYMENVRLEMNARNIATIIVVVLSILVVFFSMRLNIAARKEQIIVYRLIGINPGSIMKSFLIEMGGLTAVICVPAILITGVVLNLISGIEVLELNYFFSWQAMLILAALIIFANVLVCFISVVGMLRKPPVQL